MRNRIRNFMRTKLRKFHLCFIHFSLFAYFALNLPPSTSAIDLTSVIALTSDLNSFRMHSLGERNTSLKDDGSVCVFNADCVSGCCIYANSASGMCVAKAGVGQVCGFVYGADASLESHYRICQQCETYCCCGTACCPTDYCASALQLKPYVCTNCNTGCCCNGTCCPITYCVSTGMIKTTDLKGRLCLKCQSGCCCGDSCCISSFCKGNVVGQLCPTCATGCCCDNNLCCPASYCSDTSALSLARHLLAEFATKNSIGFPRIAQQADVGITSAMMGQSSSAASSLFPILAPAPLRVLGSGIMGARIRAHVCIQCTTGCCCEVGCCSYIYCTVI